MVLPERISVPPSKLPAAEVRGETKRRERVKRKREWEREKRERKAKESKRERQDICQQPR
jgi:hypothetical protein